MSQDQTDQVVITRLRLEAFGGIKLFELDVPPGGFIAAGTYATGKTSILRGIRALLQGDGVDAGAIHIDEQKAVLSADITAGQSKLQATRTITRKGEDSSTTKVVVKYADGTPRGGAEQMRSIFGDRSVDPDFLLRDDTDAKTRRQIILAAMPCQVTAEMLNRWCETAQEWNTDGHGQEVLARVRKMFFDRRTEVGQKLDGAKAQLKLAEQGALEAHVDEQVETTPEAARASVAAAERELAVLRDRRKQAEQREQAAAGQRAKIAKLRAEVVQIEQAQGDPPVIADWERIEAAIGAQKQKIEELKRQLTNADAHLAVLRAEATAWQGKVDSYNAADAKADELERQADELEAALAINTTGGGGDPIATQAVGAEEALQAARALVAKAEASAKARAAQEAVERAMVTVEDAGGAWEKLERVVKRLTTEAPAELSKLTNGIPGLEITPTAILFERKDIERISDCEKLQVSVEIAKRAATGARMLCIDRLERVPPAMRPAFVRKCLEGGWMLFGTLVQDGALDIVDCYQLAGKQ